MKTGSLLSPTPTQCTLGFRLRVSSFGFSVGALIRRRIIIIVVIMLIVVIITIIIIILIIIGIPVKFQTKPVP